MCQTVVVVHHEIDVLNEPDVLWAIQVYTDPSRDLDLIQNTIPNSFTTATGFRELVIDAARPLDRPMPEMNRVPRLALGRIKLSDYIEGAL